MDPPHAILDNAQLTTVVLNTNNQLGQLSAILQSIQDQLRIASNESASADPNSSGPSPYPFNSHRPHLSAKLPPPLLFDGRKPERLGSWLFWMSQFLVMSGYNVNTPEAIAFAAICHLSGHPCHLVGERLPPDKLILRWLSTLGCILHRAFHLPVPPRRPPPRNGEDAGASART